MTIKEFDNLRRLRLVGISVIDLVLTLILALVIAALFIELSLRATIIVFLILMIIAIITHLHFKVDTMLGYYIGINKKPKV